MDGRGIGLDWKGRAVGRVEGVGWLFVGLDCGVFLGGWMRVVGGGGFVCFRCGFFFMRNGGLCLVLGGRTVLCGFVGGEGGPTYRVGFVS